MNPCSFDLCITLLIYYAIYQLLQDYTAPGHTVWEGVPNATTTGNCAEEYSDLRGMLIAGAAYTFGRIVLGYMIAFGLPMALDAIVVVIEVGLALYLLYISFSGAYLVIGRYTADDINKCESLHNAAWWYFAASLLVIAIPALVFVLVFGTITTVKRFSSGAPRAPPPRATRTISTEKTFDPCKRCCGPTCKCEYGLSGLFLGGFIMAAAFVFACVPMFLELLQYDWYWDLVYFWFGLGAALFIFGFLYEFLAEVNDCCARCTETLRGPQAREVAVTDCEDAPTPYVMI